MRTNSKVTKLGLLCGAIAPAVIAAFIIAGWLITPGYSHISDTISQLGAQGRPHPWVMNSGLIIYALLTLGFAYGVYRILGHSTGARAILFFFAIYAVCIILTAIFQIELKTPEEITNLEGTLHSVFALIAFSAMIIWMMIFARLIYNYP
jgi:hypothetical membrane protein